jgi:tetratricopeptide (TPR) repeat protein
MGLFMKRFCLFVFFILILFRLDAAEEQKRTKICLNMIVKDERPVIERCLNSVKDVIDYWVIVDTGSTDGTQEAIKAYLKDIPGELHESPWVNFAHNRNEALSLAKDKGDYILLIDADEVLEGSFDPSSLVKSIYLSSITVPASFNMKSSRVLFAQSKIDWQWVGVIHEKLICSQQIEAETLSTTLIRADYTDGHRSQDPQKYLRDAEALERALITEPNNADYMYYLGQSYFNCELYDKALSAYARRANMQAWEQHTFWSMYMVGMLQEIKNYPTETVIDSFSKAAQYRPSRVEPLYRMASLFLKQGKPFLAYILTKHALTIPRSSDSVYVENWLYDYGLEILFADAARLQGSTEEYKASLTRLLTGKDISLSIREKVIKNLTDNRLLSAGLGGDYTQK